MGGFSLGEETYQHLGKFGDRWRLHGGYGKVSEFLAGGPLRYSNFGRQSCGWFNHQFYLIIVSAVFWLLSAK